MRGIFKSSQYGNYGRTWDDRDTWDDCSYGYWVPESTFGYLMVLLVT